MINRAALFTTCALMVSAMFAAPPAVAAPDKKPADGMEILSRRPIALDLDELSKTKRLTLDLDGKPRQFLLESVKTDRFGENWIGKIDGDGSFLITRHKGIVNANFDFGGRRWQIKSIAGALELRELDLKFLSTLEKKDDAKAIRLPRGVKAKANACATTATSNVIDIAVYFTPDARTAAGGLAQIEAEAYHAVVLTNQSFVNSGVNASVNPVVIREIALSEAQPDHLAYLKSINDGQVGAAHPTITNDKAQYDFDVGIVLTARTFGATIGYAWPRDSYGMNADPGNDYFYSDFASVAWASRQYASAHYTFQHELGHIFGGMHNCEAPLNDRANPLFSSSHGYCAGATMTVMGTQMYCAGATRLLKWSNGVSPTGSSGGSCHANMAQSLGNFINRIANYECENETFAGAMIKDTWTDDGSVATVGAVIPNIPSTVNNPYSLYDSVDVWNRQQNDGATQVNLHQHVERGQDNFVNVRLRNGGATSLNGNIEVWYAEANTNFTWPNNFTLAGSTPVSISGNSTKINVIKWDAANIPTPDANNPTGHFCLYVRWLSSADAMQTPEGSDVANNVAYNNNIAWKNLNIVNENPPFIFNPNDLPSDFYKSSAGRVAFHVYSGKTEFSFRAKTLDGRSSDFFKDYDVIVKFDQKTSEIMQRERRLPRGAMMLKDSAVKIGADKTILSIPTGAAKYDGYLDVVFTRKRPEVGMDSPHIIDLEQRANGRMDGGYRFQLGPIPRNGR